MQAHRIPGRAVPSADRIVRCCIRNEDDELCTLAAQPLAPFPICGTHLARLVTYLRETPLIDISKAGNPPRPIPEPTLRPQHWLDRAPMDEPYHHVVYYVRIDSLIKIGTTCRIKQRIRSFPPHTLLLATEEGDLHVEQRRHRQFYPDLAAGREWFRPSVALIDHINSLRETPLTAADLAA